MQIRKAAAGGGGDRPDGNCLACSGQCILSCSRNSFTKWRLSECNDVPVMVRCLRPTSCSRGALNLTRRTRPEEKKSLNSIDLKAMPLEYFWGLIRRGPSIDITIGTG